VIICSKCGATNALGTDQCRMCANPLTDSDASSPDALGEDSRYTTVVFQNPKTQRGTAGLVECLICPRCKAINHLGWLFCPQCGMKVDASFLQTMEPSDQAPTMPASMFPEALTEVAIQTFVGQMGPEDAKPAEENREQAASFPQPPPQSPPPAQSPTPPQPQQPAHWPPQTEQRGISEGPMRYDVEKASTSADNSTGAADIEPNASATVGDDTCACMECGSDNSSDSYVCLTCGASLPVTKTVIMSSIGSPIKPRLRLLVQGEESGPTYEIKNEATIGRTQGTITFPEDSFMSSSHARVVKSGSDFILIDEASSNGTFIRVKKQTKLERGDVILVGGQLFRFEA
jgi:ribosomal protein L40E